MNRDDGQIVTDMIAASEARVIARVAEEFRAENERLRKALDDLSTRCDCNELCACASDMMATAREALTPKGGTT